MSLNITRGSKHLALAFNHLNQWLYISLVVPYPYYGWTPSLEPYKRLHTRYKGLRFVLLKRELR